MIDRVDLAKALRLAWNVPGTWSEVPDNIKKDWLAVADKAIELLPSQGFTAEQVRDAVITAMDTKVTGEGEWPVRFANAVLARLAPKKTPAERVTIWKRETKDWSVSVDGVEVFVNIDWARCEGYRLALVAQLEKEAEG